MDFGPERRDTSRMRRSLLLAATALALAGCGAATADEAAPPAQPAGAEIRAAAERYLAEALAPREPVPVAPVPTGFRLRKMSEAGIALALPPRWAALRPQDARQPGTRRLMGGLSAELGPVVAALAFPDSPLKLVAFDPRFERGFATTASVLQAQVKPDVPYETWSSQVVAHVRDLPSLHGAVSAKTVGLPFGKALRLEYAKRSGNRLVATVQYVVVSGERQTIVTLTTLPALKTRYERLFAASLRTLQPAD
jgi:hypothetical protein